MTPPDFLWPALGVFVGWMSLSLISAIKAGRRVAAFHERAAGNLVATFGLWCLIWLVAIAFAAVRSEQLSWWVGVSVSVVSLALFTLGLDRLFKRFTVTRRLLAAAPLRDF